MRNEDQVVDVTALVASFRAAVALAHGRGEELEPGGSPQGNAGLMRELRSGSSSEDCRTREHHLVMRDAGQGEHFGTERGPQRGSAKSSEFDRCGAKLAYLPVRNTG